MILELKNIDINYGKHRVLENFNLSIEKNKMIAITGPSGRGKTSLLYIIGMLQKPSKGNINILGYENPEINSKLGRKILKENLGFVFQNFVLVESETVAQNIEAMSDVDGEYTMKEALEFVNLPGYENKKIYELSGGEQQRIAIARVLTKKFDILLGDEITGSLDMQNRDMIFDLMCKIKKLGKTIVLVTHDLELAQKCDEEIKL